jgi:hypothetical protein
VLVVLIHQLGITVKNLKAGVEIMLGGATLDQAVVQRRSALDMKLYSAASRRQTYFQFWHCVANHNLVLVVLIHLWVGIILLFCHF